VTAPAFLSAFNPVEPPEPRDLLALDRAIGEVRRTLPVRLTDADGQSVLVLPVEGCEVRTQAWLASLAVEGVELIMTRRRAIALGWESDAPSDEAVAYDLPKTACEPGTLARIADPVLAMEQGRPEAPKRRKPHALADAAIRLMKIAQLLPAVLLFPAQAGEALLSVPAQSIRDYDLLSGRLLQKVSEARVPLAEAEDARIVAFRPADGGPDHLAIIIGQPDLSKPVLTRLHSSCITGDLLGSLRCDCGEQLRGAVKTISEAGGGIVLYLVQEGRGIGIASKLRAYALQDRGLDTVDANEHLGYEPDERDYHIAGAMLRQLNVGAVRLLTNNPSKIAALSEAGITVAERIVHAFAANPHNAKYLATKAEKAGHLLPK
jgi:GTP cyclohydrolase II